MMMEEKCIVEVVDRKRELMSCRERWNLRLLKYEKADGDEEVYFYWGNWLETTLTLYSIDFSNN